MRPTRPRSDPPRSGWSGWSGWSTRTGIAAPICFGKQKLGFGDPAFNSNPTHARVNGVSIILDHPDRAFPPRKFGLQCRSTRTTPDHPDQNWTLSKIRLQRTSQQEIRMGEGMAVPSGFGEATSRLAPPRFASLDLPRPALPSRPRHQLTLPSSSRPKSIHACKASRAAA